jgi:tetratricopeptide (TPR) repeat protein
MSLRQFSRIGFIALFVFAAVFAAASSLPSNLGKIEFPTSGSKEVQRHFLRGVAALHSFWYEEALAAFRHSTKVDPNFVMGYWGEAMAHNRTLHEEQDAQAAKEPLEKIKDITKVTAKERTYLDAVTLLYGEGDKRSNDKAYSDAMEKVHSDYPEDLEAACFYALSLLGVAQNSDNKFRLQIQAGAIAMDVFRQNPDHPCAAHYTIHAFDHPDLAILALPAARRYAQIAPDSHHAQHMPAHIFVQLGMWPEAAASNEAGWRNSVAWVERDHLPTGKRDYHSLQWLHYVYLQQGLYKKADEVFRLKLMDMMEAGNDSQTVGSGANRRVGKYYERMAGASVFERERWELAATLKEPPGWEPKSYAHASLTFVRGFAAARLGQPEANQHLAHLKAIRSQGFAKNYFKRPERLDIWDLEIQAAIRVSNKEYEEAIALMKKATAIEEKLPAPSGPPRLIKPTYELFGEILLRAGKSKEAGQQFATSLLRHPNRARSLLGAARAASYNNDREEAVEWYSKLLAVWTQADPTLPELREARRYLKKESMP